MPALVVIDGPNRGAVHTLRPDVTRLGRDAGCEVVVLDERASREHARIEVEGGALRLVDGGSTNGTWLNGVRCERAALEPGDELRVGEVVYLVAGDGEDDEGPAGPVGQTTLVVPLDEATPAGKRPRRARLERATPLLGESPAMAEVHRRLLKAAAADAPALVTGESGTGKELVAQALHRASARRRGPFVAVNGAVLRGALLDSELFGHERGAFTGAVARRKGAFELADGGTLFLDEVAELSAEGQAALLRVVEGQGFRRLGGGEPLRPDVRLVTATHQDLERAVAEGRFRADLRFRLDVARIELPPLRARAGDVRLLAAHFLRQLGRGPTRFAPEALAALEAYPFPGNVRELRNLVERVAIFAEGDEVALDDLPPAVRGARVEPPAPAASGAPLPSLREVERAHVERVLREAGWNKTRAAAILGVDRVTLYAKIERYGLRDG